MKAFDGFLVLVFLCFLWFYEPDRAEPKIISRTVEMGGLIDISEYDRPRVIMTEWGVDSILIHREPEDLSLFLKDAKIKAFKSLGGRKHIVELPIGYDNINETYEAWSLYCGSCKEPLTRM